MHAPPHSATIPSTPFLIAPSITESPMGTSIRLSTPISEIYVTRAVSFFFPKRGMRLEELQQAGGVASINGVFLRGGQVQTLDHADGFADVQTGRRFEGAIRGEQHAIDAEKFQPAFGGGGRAEQSGIGVKHLEVIERALLHGFKQPLI